MPVENADDQNQRYRIAEPMTKVDVDQMCADNAQRLVKQIVPLELEADLQCLPRYQQQQTGREDEYRAADESYLGGSKQSLASDVQLVRFGLPLREECRALALIVIEADLIWRCALGLLSERQSLFALLLRRTNALRQLVAGLVRAGTNCEGYR